jgi:hypothetical protein
LDAIRNGFLTGINIASTIVITHFLFGNGILLFGRGTIRELRYLNIVLDSLCKLTRMELNLNKSYSLYNNPSDNQKRNMAQIFPMRMDPLDIGFKYLGFFLKPNNYKNGDWLSWLIKNIEDRIN